MYLFVYLFIHTAPRSSVAAGRALRPAAAGSDYTYIYIYIYIYICI